VTARFHGVVFQMAVIVDESCTYFILFLISSSDGLSGGDSDLNGGSKASSLGSAYFSCSLSSPCSPAVMTPSLPKRILSPALSPIMPIRVVADAKMTHVSEFC